MTLPEKISLLSAIAAVLAAIFTYWTTIISKRALSNTLTVQKQRDPNIHLYLADSFQMQLPKQNIFVYAFSVSISNLSDASDSISRIELEVPCHEINGPKITHVFSYKPELAEQLPQKSLKSLPFPCGLGPKACVTGWALFGIPDFILNTHIIDRFSIAISTVASKEPSYIESYLVSELHYEKMEKS